MHLLVQERRSLDEDGAAADLGQDAAELVLLSFSDSDLGAAAAAWEAMGQGRPTLRLASLARLRHPMSVDLYLDGVVGRSRCAVVRLLGGLEYWRYGAEQASALCRQADIPLVLLPGDGRDDAALAALSTVAGPAWDRLRALLDAGGPANLARALRLAAHLGGLGADAREGPETMPPWGEYMPTRGTAFLPSLGQGGVGGGFVPGVGTGDVQCDRADNVPSPRLPTPDPSLKGRGSGRPLAAVVLYRSHVLAGDTAPVDLLAGALAARGFDVRAAYADSLKAGDTAAGLAATLRAWRPAVVLNATGFSARRPGPDCDAASPLDAAGVPVLQLVLAGSTRDAWAESSRGLSQTDLAMQVALPEFDGRLLTAAISFKAEEAEVPGLQWAPVRHCPNADGIALAADRAAGWARLAGTPRGQRRVALVLSDYPGAGGGQVGHAVGLDAIASSTALLRLLAEEGYDLGPGAPAQPVLLAALADASPTPFVTLAEYRAWLAALPEPARRSVVDAWGDPAEDPAVQDGWFALRHARWGKVIAAVQPDRGSRGDRKSGYHDPDLPPRHAFIAFHLWLRHDVGAHALVQMGAHGTLEWLPGKAAAPSAACWPSLLAGGLPVLYPFIVNNPGEAAAAKRRLGAVTIGHLTPPLRAAGHHGAAAELERLLDEYAAADGMDRRRTALLRRDILDRASAGGLLAESGIPPGTDDADALSRLDAFLCDAKELQVRDGLHVFGVPPDPARRDALVDSLRRACPDLPAPTLAARVDASAGAERWAILAALDGRFVPPGPAGAPTRGRADVLPTGRNLCSLDPRGVPTRSAVTLAERAATELLRRHLQDHGDWPRRLVLNLWGSTTLRTGGEDLALALVLMGVRPVWDGGSARVTGIEVLPIALLDRPRVDVTLRISGLFRDAFEAQVALFDSAVRAVAVRDEAADWNPLAAAAMGLDGAALRRATARVFGAAPGGYGAGVGEALDRGAWDDAGALGAVYLAASAAAYGVGLDGRADPDGFAARVRGADGFVHAQDHREMDVLEGTEWAAHAGGFAAAAALLGSAPALYHADTADADAPRMRTMAEEVARVARGRAANPIWIAGMMRHGYRGAAEMARGLDGLHAFAATLPTRFDAQFDLLFDATLGDDAVDGFLRRENPAARAAMAARFREAMQRGLWRPRRNAVAATLDGAP